jgi:drug/metabolite transporter (DMT)-like permease
VVEPRGHQGLLAVFVLVWGGNFLLAEVALREMVPIAFSAGRYVIGASAGLLVLATLRQFPVMRRSLSGEDRIRILFAAVCGGVAAPWLGIEGLHLTDAGRAAVWVSLGPVLSYAMGRALRTEHVHHGGRWAIALTVGGALLLASDGLLNSAPITGDLMLAAAVTLTVLELHILAPLVKRHPPAHVAVLRTTLGAVLYTLVAIPWLTSTSWGSLEPETLAALAIGGIVAIGMGQWVQARAIRVLGPSHVSVYYLAVPVVTLTGGWLILGHQPTLLEGIAAVVILGGVAMLNFARGAPTLVPRLEESRAAA